MKKDSIIFLTINIFFSLVVIIGNIYLYQSYILIFYLYILFQTYKLLKNNIMLFLFLHSLFLFQYGKLILLPLIFNKNVEANWFLHLVFSQEDLIFVYKILFINLLGIYTGLIVFKNRIIKFTVPNFFKEKNTEQEKVKFLKILVIISLITFPCFFYNFFKIYLKMKQVGYTMLYIDKNITKINIPLYIKFLSNIFIYNVLVANSLICNFYKYKKSKIYFLILTILIYFTISLKGNRGPLFAGVFYALWYYFSFIKRKMNIFKFYSVIGLLCLLGQKLLILRGIKDSSLSIFNLIIKFINEQGITGTFLILPRYYNELFKSNIPYIFSNINFIGKNIEEQNIESYELIIKSNNIPLPYKISAFLNKEAFLNGFGTGGNYILDMWDLGGKTGIFILSLFLTLFIIYVSYNYKILKEYIRVFLTLIFFKIFFIPRNAYFISIFLSEIIKIYFVYFLIIILKFIFFKLKIKTIKKEKYENNDYYSSV